MNKIYSILLISLMTIVMASCDKEDDLNEIFEGGRFHVTGLTYNGKKVNSGVKEFYESDGTYYLVFSGHTFSGVLHAGTQISGTWAADGSSRQFSMTFTGQDGIESSTQLCTQVYSVLKHATSYKGDVNYIMIYQDSDSYVTLAKQ